MAYFECTRGDDKSAMKITNSFDYINEICCIGIFRIENMEKCDRDNNANEK